MQSSPSNSLSAAPSNRSKWIQAAWLALSATALAASLRAVLFYLGRDFDLASLDLNLLRAMAGYAFANAGVALLFFGGLALASLALGRSRNGLRMAPAIASFYAFFVWGYATLRLPVELSVHPALDGFDGIAANLGAAVIGLVLATILLIAGIVPGALKRSVRMVQVTGTALLVVGLGLWLTRGHDSKDERPNVLLISIDTLRTDHLASYGYGRNTAPNLEAFMDSALRFEHAYTNHPWTLTSHATMLTGMLPSAHGINPDRALDPKVPTVAALLRYEGYRTVAVVDDNDWLHPRFGYGRGFERYLQLDGSAKPKVEEMLASLDDLAFQGDAPFFAFAHFYDVHSDWQQLPYDSDPEAYEQYAGWYQGDFTGCDPELGCASRLISELNQRGTPLTGDELVYLRDLYDAGITTFDRQLGLLFEGLRARGLDQNTIVIVTSDHGEEFFEHGRGLHDQHYNECLQVPMFVRVPDGYAMKGFAGNSSGELVELADLAPTILELCELVPTSVDSFQGRSLLPLLEGDPAGIPPSPGVLMDPGTGAFGVRNLDYAVIRFKRNWYLFDRRTDPGELDDLFGREVVPPEDMTRIRELLVERREATLALGEKYSDHPTLAPRSDEVVQSMADLGYVDDGTVVDPETEAEIEFHLETGADEALDNEL